MSGVCLAWELRLHLSPSGTALRGSEIYRNSMWRFSFLLLVLNFVYSTVKGVQKTTEYVDRDHRCSVRFHCPYKVLGREPVLTVTGERCRLRYVSEIYVCSLADPNSSYSQKQDKILLRLKSKPFVAYISYFKKIGSKARFRYVQKDGAYVEGLAYFTPKFLYMLTYGAKPADFRDAEFADFFNSMKFF